MADKVITQGTDIKWQLDVCSYCYTTVCLRLPYLLRPLNLVSTPKSVWDNSHAFTSSARNGQYSFFPSVPPERPRRERCTPEYVSRGGENRRTHKHTHVWQQVCNNNHKHSTPPERSVSKGDEVAGRVGEDPLMSKLEPGISHQPLRQLHRTAGTASWEVRRS